MKNRKAASSGAWQLVPPLASGLKLRFLQSFAICSTLPRLQARIATEKPEYERWGIHVLAPQTADGAITLGDSIHGAGMLGLTACAIASDETAACVIAIELDVERREMALQFGAGRAIDSALPREEIAARVMEVSRGRGADAGLDSPAIRNRWNSVLACCA